ncbi:MAG: hypothetical protein IV100_14400 [Myxococcales bacterium]|nr:hypothetical protein [Myxococcales bacterium]
MTAEIPLTLSRQPTDGPAVNKRPPDHDALAATTSPHPDDAGLRSADDWQRVGEDAYRVGDYERAGRLFRRALDAPLPSQTRGALPYSHALPLERLTLLALAEGDPVFADIYALRSVRADPSDGPARVAQLRAAYAAGRGDDGALERLLAQHPELPSTHSFASDVAWARGDVAEARRLWARGAACSPSAHERELDHQNRCLASLYVDAAATTAPEPGPLPFGLRDVESLAAAVTVALRHELPLPDTTVPAAVLTPAIVPWLELWIATGADEALRAFQRGAVAHRERLPGADALLNFG